MQWFIAKLIYKIICGAGTHTPQFDEQLRIIHANNESLAFEKAKTTGKEGEDTFLNRNGELVQWQFINVVELYNLNTLDDGSEICSNVHEAIHSENYIELINSKADRLRSRFIDGVTEPI